MRDTTSAGMTVSFVMECFEYGILSKEESGGVEMRFGNAEALSDLADGFAKREGFGDVLADGGERAARQIGPGLSSTS